MDFDENVELLRKARAGDMEAKNQIILQNSPLVKSIVKRYKNKGVEYDDLFQLGQLGMVKAMNNFDESFGVKFSTYAVPMIAGEIKRFLRDDGSIKVSRSIKNNFRAIQKHIDECRAAGLPSPSAKDLAQKFGIDEKELMFVMESWRMPVSLFDNADKNLDGGHTIADKIANFDEQNEMIDKIVLKDVISSLDKKDRLLIVLRYFRDKTQSEVAKMMNVSQVQVSRIETKVLGKLKSKLKQ